MCWCRSHCISTNAYCQQCCVDKDAVQIIGSALWGLKSNLHKENTSLPKIPYIATEIKNNKDEYDTVHMYTYVVINKKLFAKIMKYPNLN